MNLFISVLYIIGCADGAIMWNPYNKVVQSHRDGTIYYLATNLARKWRGLPTPWHPDMGESEVRMKPVP